jgi:hypothetical protein
MAISHKPISESGMEWYGSIRELGYKASGSFGPTLGHLSLYAEGTDGATNLLGTVTWSGPATDGMLQISSILAMLAAELRETLTQENTSIP